MVWTDFGGVVVPGPRESLPAFAGELGVSTARMTSALTMLASELGTAEPLALIEAGRMPEGEWCRRLGKHLGVSVPLTALAGPWFVDRPLNEPWLAALGAVRGAGVSVGLLSNMPPSWASAWRRMVPAVTFDVVLTSAQAGCRKPEPAIFAAAECTVTTRTARHVLVDDSIENCQGARAAGWLAVHFTSTVQADADLTKVLGNEGERNDG